jgi:hypothetical protein
MCWITVKPEQLRGMGIWVALFVAEPCVEGPLCPPTQFLWKLGLLEPAATELSPLATEIVL